MPLQPEVTRMEMHEEKMVLPKTHGTKIGIVAGKIVYCCLHMQTARHHWYVFASLDCGMCKS